MSGYFRFIFMTFSRYCFLLPVLCLVASPCLQAQDSSAEAVTVLQDRAASIHSDYLTALRRVQSDPALLAQGAVETATQDYVSRTGELEKKVATQIQYLGEKQQKVSEGPLSDADKRELLSALQKQIEPLHKLDEKLNTASTTATAVSTTAGTASWKTIHDSFSSVSGSEKAGQRLKQEINAYMAKLPDFPAVTPPRKTSVTASSIESSLPAKTLVTSSPTSSPIQLGANPEPTPKPGKFDGFRIFPHWFWNWVFFGVVLAIIAAKVDSDFFTGLLFVIGLIVGGYWLLDLVWRVVKALFSS